MKRHNANLRLLAAAYHQGVINEEQYLALRNQQLGAIQFDKTYPPLPKLISQGQEYIKPHVLVQPVKSKRKLYMGLLAVGFILLLLLAINIWFL